MGILGIVVTAFQFVAMLISAPLAQSTFSEAFGFETDADWSLYIIWLAWMNSLANLVLAIVVFLAAYLDK